MKQVEFGYDLKQNVRIKALKAKGFIVGYYCGDTGIQYQVSYFVDGDRKVAYLYPEEIAETDESDALGFQT